MNGKMVKLINRYSKQFGMKSKVLKNDYYQMTKVEKLKFIKSAKQVQFEYYESRNESIRKYQEDQKKKEKNNVV